RSARRCRRTGRRHDAPARFSPWAGARPGAIVEMVRARPVVPAAHSIVVQPGEEVPDGLIRRLLGAVGRRDARTAAEATVVAVASGKGGTGKSFFATSLAIELSRQMRVVLVDCDYGLGSDHLLLGTSPALTLRDVVAGRCRPRDALVATAYGPLLLPGGSGIIAMVEMSDGELTALAA